ncbi:hypothetical protein [Saccharothrix lopnurensis]|uniref:VWFA domain-containing protein n=1 Tax=Saccharothrix lopnurensis TaxID=1670621 RepID=A0ABW1NXY4_9PSEU
MRKRLIPLLGLTMLAGVVTAPPASAIDLVTCTWLTPEYPHISSYNLKNNNAIDIKASTQGSCRPSSDPIFVTATMTLERQGFLGIWQTVAAGAPITKSIQGTPQTWRRGELFAVMPCVPGVYRGRLERSAQVTGGVGFVLGGPIYSPPREIDCQPKRVSMVIDDTGSMSGVIGSVSSALANYISARPEDEYTRWSLTTFKDSPSDVGTTDDRAQALGWVNALSADGGDDCPEDALGGISSGLASLGDDPEIDRQMIVATDASAHSGDVDGIIASARATGAKVNVLLTGDCGEGAAVAVAGQPSRGTALAAAAEQVSSQVVLKRIAEETGGKYFYLPYGGEADFAAALAEIFAEIADPTPPDGPTTIAATTGDGQSTPAGTPFPTALTATVTGSDARPSTDTPVTFTVEGPAAFPGGATSATASTGADGLATAPTLTAGTTTGAVTVTATAAGVRTPATFTATVTAPVPASIAATSGGGQSATPGTAFAAPLVATVTSTANTPSADAEVAFAVTGGTATFPGGATTATVGTDADGRATAPTLTAGTTTGPVTVTATAGGVTTPATFTGTVTAPQGAARADVSVSISAPTGARSGSPFTATLTVRNNGPSTATSIYSALTLPKGMRVTNAGGGLVTDNGRAVAFRLSSLDSGGQITHTLTVTSDRTLTGTRDIAAAGASTRVLDSDYRNNAALARVTLRR